MASVLKSTSTTTTAYLKNSPHITDYHYQNSTVEITINDDKLTCNDLDATDRTYEFADPRFFDLLDKLIASGHNYQWQSPFSASTSTEPSQPTNTHASGNQPQTQSTG